MQEQSPSVGAEASAFIRRLAAPLEAVAALLTAVHLVRQNYEGLGPPVVCAVLACAAIGWTLRTWFRRDPPRVAGERATHAYGSGVRWTALVVAVGLIGTTGLLANRYAAQQRKLPDVKLDLLPSRCEFTNRDTAPLKSVRLRALEHVAFVEGWQDGQAQVLAMDLALDRGATADGAVAPGGTVTLAHVDPRVDGACPHHCSVRLHPTNETTLTTPSRSVDQCVVFWECRAEFERSDGSAYEKSRFAVLKLDKCLLEPLAQYRERLQVNDGPVRERWNDDVVQRAYALTDAFKKEHRDIQRTLEQADREDGLTKR